MSLGSIKKKALTHSSSYDWFNGGNYSQRKASQLSDKVGYNISHLQVSCMRSFIRNLHENLRHLRNVARERMTRTDEAQLVLKKERLVG